MPRAKYLSIVLLSLAVSLYLLSESLAQNEGNPNLITIISKDVEVTFKKDGNSYKAELNVKVSGKAKIKFGLYDGNNEQFQLNADDKDKFDITEQTTNIKLTTSLVQDLDTYDRKKLKLGYKIDETKKTALIKTEKYEYVRLSLESKVKPPPTKMEVEIVSVNGTPTEGGIIDLSLQEGKLCKIVINVTLDRFSNPFKAKVQYKLDNDATFRPQEEIGLPDKECPITIQPFKWERSQNISVKVISDDPRLTSNEYTLTFKNPQNAKDGSNKSWHWWYLSFLMIVPIILFIRKLISRKKKRSRKNEQLRLLPEKGDSKDIDSGDNLGDQNEDEIVETQSITDNKPNSLVEQNEQPKTTTNIEQHKEEEVKRPKQDQLDAFEKICNFNANFSATIDVSREGKINIKDHSPIWFNFFVSNIKYKINKINKKTWRITLEFKKPKFEEFSPIEESSVDSYKTVSPSIRRGILQQSVSLDNNKIKGELIFRDKHIKDIQLSNDFILKFKIKFSKVSEITSKENNEICIKFPEDEIPMKIFWDRLFPLIKDSNLVSELNEKIGNVDGQESLKRFVELIEKIYNNQSKLDNENDQKPSEKELREQEELSPQDHDKIKTEIPNNLSVKSDGALVLIISDLQIAIQKSAYKDWKSDFDKLEEIVKLQCSTPPSLNDEAIRRLMDWGWNFYTIDLGIKENIWKIFKENMMSTLNIIVLDSVSVPFNSEDHLNIRGDSNEVSRVIKPGYKVAAWAENGGKVLTKANVIT